MIVVVATTVAVVAFHGGGHHRAVAAPAATTTTAPPPSTTTTTIDPGVLSQTSVRPSGTDPAFQARMRVLWGALTSGHAADGLAAFFPLSAYKQAKAIADPAYDWQHRLVANFFGDIGRVHPLVAHAQLVDVMVPDAMATWVRPGAEANRIGYWRVYSTVIDYRNGAATGKVVVISLISWRGQWYVVHFRTPPS